jgi:hypothetical protein
MPKATKIPGLTDYGDDDNAPPKQTVYPKSQGGQVPPTTAQGTPTKIPGLKDYGSTPVQQTASTPGDSRGDGTWSGLAYDVFHPQPANLDRPQTWRDWVTKTYSPTAQDYGNAALDDVSFGGADYAQAKITGQNLQDIRARTANSQAALGPMGPIVNALTYAIPGTGEMKMVATPGKLIRGGAELLDAGRYGTAAVEGGTAAALSSAGHQAGDPNGIDALKVAKDAGWGAAGGTVMQGLGDVTAPAVQRVSDYVTGKPGTGSEAWNWRTRAASGDDTLPISVQAQQNALPANDPAQPALAKLQGALAQPTDPGIVAHAATGVTGWAAGHYLGGSEIASTGLGIAGPFASKYFVNKPAQMINTADRNINVGQALDQAYPALYPNASTTDTSGWANTLRQGWIGGDRPTDQAGDAQWW